jgi:uncharacterized membrane protein
MSRSQGLGFKLLLAGFILILSGVILIIASSLLGDGSVSTGVAIFVGPIPIIIGTGINALLAVFLAAVLTILCLIVFFLMKRMKWVAW